MKRDVRGKIRRDAKEDGMTSSNRGLVERDDVTGPQTPWLKRKKTRQNKMKTMYKRERVRRPIARLVPVYDRLGF